MEEVTNVFVAVHAGAGTHSKANEDTYHNICKTACQQALSLLRTRSTATEAVTAAVAALEDAEFTNAGWGSNLTIDGTVECDACLMDGQSLYFGAVGAVSGVKNPVQVAKKLAEEQKHGLLPCGRVRPSVLVGSGAQQFCSDSGIDVKNNMVSKTAFKTYNKYKRKCQRAELTLSQPKKMKIAKGEEGLEKDQRIISSNPNELSEVQDTVGAVCVDYQGNIAAASSSGGIWLKHAGRLGPAAVYGSGCWAQNQISKTKAGVAAVTSGCGEHLIQTLLAKTCCDAVRASEDLSKGLASSFEDDFLSSELLKNVSEKFGGALVLKSCIESPDVQDNFVELSWIHSTPSMCLAYMAGNMKAPRVTMSRLSESVVPGTNYTMGGHMTCLS